jgi:SAM-dependent methyltransferase
MLPPAPAIRRVLDLGCGTGRFTGLLADLYGTAVIGVEPSRAMLAGREPLDPTRAAFLAAAAEALPLAAGSRPRAHALTRRVGPGVPRARKISLRGLSSLQAISDEAFARGLAAFEKHCRAGGDAGPIYEPVELFVFRRA